MKYCISTRENNRNTNWYFDKLEIDQIILINSTKYKIKGIGVRTKQQPVTKEWYYDLSKDYITCLQLTNRTNSRGVSFKYHAWNIENKMSESELKEKDLLLSLQKNHLRWLTQEEYDALKRLIDKETKIDKSKVIIRPPIFIKENESEAKNENKSNILNKIINFFKDVQL